MVDDAMIIDRLARIESRLEAIKESIEFGDRGSAQLVAALKGHVDHVAANLSQTVEANREAHGIIHRQLDAHNARLDSIEKFQSKLIGVGLILTAGTGLVTAFVLRALQ